MEALGKGPLRRLVLITAVANQKGGTGKSVVATNLVAARIEAGARVLLCDIDPQGTAPTWWAHP